MSLYPHTHGLLFWRLSVRAWKLMFGTLKTFITSPALFLFKSVRRRELRCHETLLYFLTSDYFCTFVTFCVLTLKNKCWFHSVYSPGLPDKWVSKLHSIRKFPYSIRSHYNSDHCYCLFCSWCRWHFLVSFLHVCSLFSRKKK